ncbi:MAG: glycosyltransferase [Bdellovibrionales bacterium]|nr:glycosyltransferase [Bdellovibrionales bacterium]
MLHAVLFLGLAGVLGMTWLFPLLGRGFAALSGIGVSRDRPSSRKVRRVAVLVPAHNEESALPHTLESLKRAIAVARAAYPGVEFELRVGADGCTDRTAEVARAHGAEALEFNPNIGKWRGLHELAKASASADWIVYGDAGIAWPEDLLLRCLPLCTDPATMAVAPTYRNPEAGPVEQAIWAFERHLKSIESSAGGPVSIHGATVLYRREELMEAFARLEGRSWLNDDVVMPLYLRLLFPTLRIVYAAGVGVHEGATERSGPAPAREFGRRRRMVMGNVQWIRDILPAAWDKSFAAGLLSLRRVFRLFWAYWALLCAVAALMALSRIDGAGLLLALAVGAISAGGVALASVSSRLRAPFLSLVESAFASLLAPYYIATASGSEKVGWR